MDALDSSGYGLIMVYLIFKTLASDLNVRRKLKKI